MKKQSEELSQEMIERINSYSEEIISLETFVEQVRTRPGMYIGPKNERGLLNMIREVFQNSVDQEIDPLTPCDIIIVFYDAIKHITIIEDNGLGIPFNDMIRVFTKQHTGRNFKKHAGQYSSGFNGVGAKVVNALSDWFIVESYKYTGEAKRIEFLDGILQGEIMDIPNTDKKQGTKVSFHPSHEIMGETPLPAAWVMNLIRLILSLLPIGTKIDYTHIDENGKTLHELMINEDGILTDLILKMTKPLIAPIIIHEDTGEMKADIAFCYDSVANPIENITAFSNFCPTSRGTHISGFIDGVVAWFKKYMNDIYLGPKSKTNVIPLDIKCGLNAMVSVACLEPEFTGQAKDELSNKEMQPFVKDVVMRGLDGWAKANPQDLQKIAKYLKDIADIRQKSDTEKVKLSEKYEANHLSGLPFNYAEPSGGIDDELEIWIVEGDSAGGSAKSGRDKKRQGVLPIRGKIINPYTNSFKKFMDNLEVQAICRIITNGELKTFTLAALRSYPVEKVIYKKIIFGADADPDGAHINALLLRVFLFLFPQLIKAGRVYKSVPPLFGINTGKKGMQYFTEYIDYIKFRQKKFNEKHVISMANGTQISNTKALALLMKNVDYVYELNKVANRRAVDPHLVELILLSHIIGDNNKKIISNIKLKPEYKYVDTEIKGNNMIIKGNIGNTIDTLYVNNRLYDESKEIMAIIKDNDCIIHYQMDGQLVTLYDIMTVFENIKVGAILEHFKGLGEMNSQKLFESTMDPNSDRMLIQYTIDDISSAVTAIRAYESDKKKLLAHIGKVTRADIE